MDITSSRISLMDKLDQIKGLEYAASVVYWDMTTGAGGRGVKARSSALGILSSKVQELMVSEAFLNDLKTLEDNQSDLSTMDAQIIKEARYKYDRISKIPAEEYRGVC